MATDWPLIATFTLDSMVPEILVAPTRRRPSPAACPASTSRLKGTETGSPAVAVAGMSAFTTTLTVWSPMSGNPPL
ncbi:hypothetical protein QP939_41620 [Amycolatopsis nalaikhensis]|uniref:Uncharacterized protein n=1 Tax=Amycolatopsis nalaikhensis TaxID=715472 RepID=A0ABY8XI05_9PSEU|nr:hypothetical protein [Amycolatopsis sp. 2-2]WIV55265.1 hypothetical protein QP939_41620 [Amycolatopsis sp. 2-2]